MAGSGTGKFVQGLTLAVITVTVGAAIGYYAGGAHTGPSASATAGVQEAGSPPGAASVPSRHPPRIKVARPDSDYSAPGAPRIRIVEAKTPSLGDSSPDAPPRPRALRRSSDTSDTTDIPTPDAEASQEASQTAPAHETSHDTTPSVPKPPTGDTPADTGPPQTGAVNTGETDSTAGTPPAKPDATTPAVTPPKRATPPSSPTDPEASQVGDTSGTDKTEGAAQYRVQAGTFADAKNAHDYLTNLQSRGYDASLRAESQGGQTIYHVQVGSYHDRAAAEDAAAGFRHDGVPVTIAPITPQP